MRKKTPLIIGMASRIAHKDAVDHRYGITDCRHSSKESASDVCSCVAGARARRAHHIKFE